MDNTTIEVRGAREHNLRDVSITLPRNQLIVFSGVSGSGKSSMAFDTLYAEGQRRYLESLSSYARQFIGQLPKPNVDYISGLSPAISISQKSTSSNPRSTVGTVTEIYDFLRVLYARVATGFCSKCNVPITSQTRDQIVARIQELKDSEEYLVLAPIIRGQKGEYRDLFESLQRQGFARARIDGQVMRLANAPALARQQKHDIEVVVSKIYPATSPRTAIGDAVNEALRLGMNTLIVIPWEEPPADAEKLEAHVVIDPEDEAPPEVRPRSAVKRRAARTSNDLVMSSEYACPQCGASSSPPSPQLLSFNSPVGMCPTCEGLGEQFTFSPTLIIPDTSKSLKRGAIELLGPWNDLSRWHRHQLLSVSESIEKQYELQSSESITMPWSDLPPEAQHEWLYGTGERHITFTWKGGNRPMKYGGVYEGLIAQLLEQYRNAKSPTARKRFEKYMEKRHCDTCNGTRLNRQARQLKLQGAAITPVASEKKSDAKLKADGWLSLPELCQMSIEKSLAFLKSLKLDEIEQKIAGEAIREITNRLQFLLNVGLDYLSLSRSAPSLSGGEAQRIRLASQIGSGLVGVLYVLDEPSIGLHPRDNDRLIESLKHLRDQGNSLLVVEHDEDTMRAADLILDFGPGPGVRGGEVVGFGSMAELAANDRSLTGKFLSGKETMPVPDVRRPGNGLKISVSGATHNNLKNIDVDIPLGCLVCVTGVSGSGKSSLINDIVVPVLRRRLHAAEDVPGEHRELTGIEHLDKVIAIDQSPIGRTPRSNPATYVKIFDEIRNLFADLSEAKRRGYQPGRFSFNVSGGRCEACEGNGSNRLEMDFLADLWVGCPVCGGKRFNHETLQVKFKDQSIADVLEMDIQQALELFENVPKIAEKLRTLHDVGLDYIKLGQPSPTLSGGEAQRVKLAKELARRDTGRTLYLLDEPTTGLHFHDIRLLLKVLQDLVDRGNTVLVIEHNLDIIKAADWLIDIGPEGGEAGGQLVFTGTPDEIIHCEQSHTGKSLAKHLAAAPILGETISESKARAAEKTKVVKPLPKIRIQGAIEHNLQDVSLDIDHNSMTVFCGPSGSGKSSLAMDTIYAEGQRRYVESLSSYARQFVGQMPKPRVERIEGLAPAIAIEQKTVAHNPRSTVGTVTEIYDYLRVLMARLATPHCPECDQPVSTQTADDITNHLLGFEEGTRLVLAAPLHWQPTVDPDNLWQDLRSAGLARVRVNGRIYALEDVPRLSSTASYEIEAVVDRITVSNANRSRIADSVELALSLGNGIMLAIEPGTDEDETRWQVKRHSQHLACRACGYSMQPLTPHSFSFNSPLGWCPDCEGLGTQTGTSPALLLEPSLSLRDGAIRMWPIDTELGPVMLDAFCHATHIPADVPVERLTSGQRRQLLYGTDDRWFRTTNGKGIEFEFQWKGLFPTLEQAAKLSPLLRAKLAPFVAEVPCSACDGSRLNKDAASAKFRGLNVGDLTQGTLAWLHTTINSWDLNEREQQIAGELLRELRQRSEFLLDVGLDYLSLSRPANTLSGGESQRIRLSSQLGSGLCGVLYVLDEPTIGLHPRDNVRLIRALHKLRNIGNTLIVVEHDRDVIENCDQVCDFGPGSGRNGGTLVGQGTPSELALMASSVTGPFINDTQTIPIPKQRRTMDKGGLELRGARANNLRNVNVDIPFGRLNVITGPSGSGKSSLIHEVLYPALHKQLAKQSAASGTYDSLAGINLIDKVIRVDQSPLGSNPSSTPATYTGVFDLIRQLYSQLPDARARGYTQRQFSFNVPGGRCEKCEGNGQIKIEMHFLPDVWVQCDSCHGRRFTEDTLSIEYHGFTIHDVLEMQIGQAVEVFDNIPKIRRILQTLKDVGLEYISLGQSAPTLSGGEAQRVKLAAELARPDTGKTLYLLDEPTTGLHFTDIIKLLEVLQRLVDLGNTVLVIEHNLDVIKAADWIIDIGPEAGADGGRVVFSGTPEDLVTHARAANPELFGAPKKRGKAKAATKSTKGGKNGAIASEEPLLRSHTGEALIPILETAEYFERDTYDPEMDTEMRAGDLELEHIGRDTLLPWQADGKRWHTKDSVDRKGEPIRWDRQLLIKIADTIEAAGGFSPIAWDNRSVVEVAGPIKSRGWFLHAITAETWLLKLKIRVPRRTFTKNQLESVVALPTLNQMDGIEQYGNEPRVRARLAGAWMELELQPHTLGEIDTPKFWKWFKEAMDAFLGKTPEAEVVPESTDPEKHAPWKVLKQRWHSLRKGFPPGRNIVWPAETLSVFIQSVHQTSGEGRWRWDEQTHARYFLPGHDEPWITLHTKRPEGLIAVLNGPKGFQPGRLKDSLPVPVQITTRGDSDEHLQISFTGLQQPRDASVKKLLAAHLEFLISRATTR